MAGGSLYDVTSCLPGPMFLLGGLCLWSHVPFGGGGVSVQGGLCPGEVFVQGGLCQGDPPDRDPLYDEGQVVRILLECFLVVIIIKKRRYEQEKNTVVFLLRHA